MRKVLPFVIAAVILFFVGCSPSRKDSLYPKLKYDDENAKYVFIDKLGNEKFDKSYDDILKTFEGDYAVVILDGKVAIIDRKGESVLSGLESVFEIKGNLATVKKNDICELYDLKTKDVLLKNDYIKIGENDIYTVFKDGLWGYVDLKNNLILEPQFDEAYMFGKNSAVGVKDSKVFIVSKDFEVNPSEFTDAIKINEKILLAHKDDKSVLLNYDGQVLNSDIKGDITEANDELYSTFERIDGELLRKVYKIDGSPVTDEAFTDVRLLNDGFFAAGKDGVFALHSAKDGRLTEHDYTFLDSQFFDENGGKITAIKDDHGFVLDKNGRVTENFDDKLSSLIFDGDVFVGANDYGIVYFDKDKNKILECPNITHMDGFDICITKEDYSHYPFVISKSVPKSINDNIKNEVRKISESPNNTFSFEQNGKILKINVMTKDYKYKFMVNLQTGEVVKPNDIFFDGEIMNYIVEKIKKENGLDSDSKLLCFSYDGDLTIVIRGEKDFTKLINREKIEKFLNIESGEYFKVVNETN